MTPAELADLVLAAVRRAVDSGALAVTPPDVVVVERPRQKEHGDYATNVALQLARQAGRSPRDVAAVLQRMLADEPALASVDIAGPGFLNFRVAGGALGELARTIVTAGREYGRSEVPHGKKVNLEFVSANPTGPMHVGHARWAAVGDALANLLDAAGNDVTREFYVNDAGTQIDRLAASLYARARQQTGDAGYPFPEDGYHGDYVIETARAILDDNTGLLDQPDDKVLAVFKEEGLSRLLAEIQQTLLNFGVHFDVWFSERSLHAGGIAAAIERFREQGHIFEAEGAVWMRTTDFGDDKDRVLVRRDGVPTYFAADCAYYHDKRQRGFEKVIIQVGADHHGYIGRMRAMVSCYGDHPDQTLTILIGQMVNLTRHGEPVKMSKRAGTFVAFDDLVGATGNDAARYSLVRSSVDSSLDLDIDLVTRHDPENPVFYVQMAHARISGILTTAAARGYARGGSDEFQPELLTHEREVDLLGALGEFPRIVRSASELNAPHRVARYLESLAGVFHRFYDSCRVVPNVDVDPTPDDLALTKARLWLCEATKTVLANGLGLLGVSAPDRM